MSDAQNDHAEIPAAAVNSAAPPAPNEDELERAEADVQQFVIFICGEEVFAVDMTPVQEIIRVPEVVRVPLSPPTLDGLANLRGKVLPIISLRRIFGLPERASDDCSRAVVIDQGQPLGFVVDRVSSVVGVESSRIADVGALRATVNTELLSGLLRDVSGFSMVMVLDFARLISSEFAAINTLADASGSAGTALSPASVDEQDNGDELQLVSFEVDQQEYAIAIENVQEIVQIPENVVHVPRAQSHVLGVMTLRHRLLPLVSLRCLFDLSARATDEHSRIVVIALGHAAVGIVTDSVNEVLRVPRSAVDAVPALLARDDSLSDLEAICRLNDGKRLVAIIATERLFRHSTIREALNTVTEMQTAQGITANTEHDDDVTDDEEQVVVFRLDKEEFGVPIESVQEIVRVPEELTHIPKAPPFVEGVINLRGVVLPVIDQRRRFGLPTVPRSDRQRIMVFLLAGVRTGFIVDSVAEVLKIHKSVIEPAPQLSTDQARLIARVANLEQQHRLIQLLDPSCLIADDDRRQLAALAQ